MVRRGLTVMRRASCRDAAVSGVGPAPIVQIRLLRASSAALQSDPIAFDAIWDRLLRVGMPEFQRISANR
ncbi:hypothetical protein [Sphingomonas sp.]|uniref:hypothetical protein n=1 Tax=Sphingomonas sp. TaxID=28214 RepID=UPI002FD94130